MPGWKHAWALAARCLGSFGALICNLLGEMFDAPIFIALAWFGYFLNLFNLTPVGMLDGGRIVTALSRWLWLPGFALLLLVRVEVSEFYYLVDYPLVAAADLFAISQTNRRRTALFRSHTIPALDNVDLVLRFDRGLAFRNARRTAGLKQVRSAFSRSRPRCDCSIIKPALLRRLSPVPARFSRRSRQNVCHAARLKSGAIPTKCNDDECSSVRTL